MSLLEKFYQKFGGMTEEYRFYGDTVELRYDPKDHIYLLVLPDGTLEPQDGVTSVVHIIDKSSALIPWGCKMMSQKIMLAAPKATLPTGDVVIPQMSLADFEKLVMEGKSAHKEKLEEAATVGHTAHDWIERYIKSVLAVDDARKFELLAKFPSDERASNCCIAALEWMKDHNVRWISTERKIYSRKYKYAGTMDGIALVDSCSNPGCKVCCDVEPFTDHLTVVDWKSSNYLYLEYLYQTAAYTQAFNEEQGYILGSLAEALPASFATDRWVIRLGKEDGEFEPWYAPSDTFESDWKGFYDALSLTRDVRITEARIKDRKAAQSAVEKAAKLALRAAQDEAERVEKARIKAEKQQARLEALANECPKAKKYRGKKAPSCKTNGGGPCTACTAIYEKRQACAVTDILSSQGDTHEERTEGLGCTGADSSVSLDGL